MMSMSGAAIRANRICVTRAMNGVTAKQIAAPRIEANATLHTITYISVGCSLTIRGPG